MSDALRDALVPLAKLLAPLVRAELAENDNEWRSQYGSPLGARKHRAAVKRRRERGEGGAYVNGRKYFLTPQALAEECERESRATEAGRRLRKTRPQNAELDAFQRELAGGLSHLRQVK